MSWQENIGTIKEVYTGHYQIILDFATNSFLKYLLNDSYKYVWVSLHSPTHSLEWNTYQLPLLDNQSSYPVLARNINFDFVMETKAFKEVYLKFPPGITLVQLNKLPNYYIDSARIKGKTLYDLLYKECDYLYELDIPSATDYGTLVSANKDWLQSILVTKT
jgi:hypothetical protein